MTRKNLVKRAGRILIKEGPIELIQSSGRFVYKRTPFSPEREPFQIKRSEQTEKRWKLIESELSEDDDNLLDIGCDAGVLTSKAARTGRLAIGIDRHEVAHSQKKFPGAFEHALNLTRDMKNLGFVNMEITPDNVDSLPSTDVVLLLSVYHYWYREFGKATAERMLSTFKGANLIFFSSTSVKRRYDPSNYKAGTDEVEEIPDFVDRDKKSVNDYHKRVLSSTLGDDYSIRHLGDIHYESETRYLLLASKNS